MLKVSAKDLEKLETQLDGAKARAQTYKGRAEKAIHRVAQSAVAGGAGFALGAIEGYTGGVEVVGIPLPLLASGLAHGAGLFLDGSVADYAHAVGDAGLVVFGATMGRGIGADMKKKHAGGAAGANDTPAIAGDEPPGARLTDRDMQDLEQLARGRARAG